MQIFTTIEPVPPGYQYIATARRAVRAEPVIVLLGNLDELGNLKRSLVGLVITRSDSCEVIKLSDLAWHVKAPDCLIALLPALGQCLFSVFSLADQATQEISSSNLKVQRFSRELDMTRKDYNELTLRLGHQVRELQSARDALRALNGELEARVQRRTQELGEANRLLSNALENLKRAQKELVRREQVAGLGALVAGVAHELNTPIGNALLISTTLHENLKTLKRQYAVGALKRNELENHLEASDDILQVVERNLRQAGEIVCHFKQLSIDQASDGRRCFKLDDVIAGAISAMRPKFRGKPYVIDIERVHPIEMDGYPGSIIQITTNLVMNALIHGFDGRTEGRITITTSHLSETCIGICFSDDGIGIPEHKQQHVFDPFYTTKLGKGGSGLGLYMVFNQVSELLGGHVELRSEEGKGTSFLITIPRVAPVNEATVQLGLTRKPESY